MRRTRLPPGTGLLFANCEQISGRQTQNFVLTPAHRFFAVRHRLPSSSPAQARAFWTGLAIRGSRLHEQPRPGRGRNVTFRLRCSPCWFWLRAAYWGIPPRSPHRGCAARPRIRIHTDLFDTGSTSSAELCLCRPCFVGLNWVEGRFWLSENRVLFLTGLCRPAPHCSGRAPHDAPSSKLSSVPLFTEARPFISRQRESFAVKRPRIIRPLRGRR